MASPLKFPFNNEPTGFDIKTSSYTIPSGKYARVKAVVDIGARQDVPVGAGSFTLASPNSCSINGTTIARSVLTCTIDGGRDTVLPSYAFTLKAIDNDNFNTPISVNGAAISEAASGTQGTRQGEIDMAGGTLVTGGVGVLKVAVSLNPIGNNTDYIWVPSGTVLDGVGNFKWIVEEYNSLS